MAGYINGFDLNLLWIVCLSSLLFVRVDTEDIYSNSFLSPNSAENKIELTSDIPVAVTSGPVQIYPTVKTENKITPHGIVRTRRSPNPILSKAHDNDDLMLASKNIADNLESNDVEYAGRILTYIQPSKTEKAFNPNGLVQQTSTLLDLGEAQGTPQGRSLPLLESLKINATAMTQSFVTPSYLHIEKGRQANPDIQDIITGIVKLLNGNVNVQANAAPVVGRPLRPISTRINNRGPPRITDVPALPPDFDVPAEPPLPQIVPSKIPTPYPFDLPPLNTSPAIPYMPLRPGIQRPTWNRPPNRRPLGPYRRPKPPFKPIPIFTPDETSSISTTSDKAATEDILTLNLGHDDLVESTTEVVEESETLPITDEDMDYERNKAKSTSKMSKNTNSSSIILESTETISPTVTSYSIPIEPTSNSTVILNVNTTVLTPTNGLESSIVDVIPIDSTITEELPSILSTNEVKSTIQNLNINATSVEVSSSSVIETTFTYLPYRPRPGIVLDDTEYKPGGLHRQPILTAQPPVGQLGDIFDITVSAIQGPGGPSANDGKPFVIPVDIDHLQTQDIITTPIGNEGFVSIDGKRTYLNLFGEPTDSLSIGKSPVVTTATSTSSSVIGTGYAVAQPPDKSIPAESTNIIAATKPTPRRPAYNRKPSQPPVRIDTCIVGDDSTCDATQHEICKTEAGVSACHCRPGNARRKHRDPCRKIVSILLSLRIDRLYERRVVWANELGNHDSESYQQLSYETERAMESAMSMTPFSDEFLGIKVNNIYKGDRSAGQAGVFVNITLQLEANSETTRPTVRNDIQRHLLGVIQRRSNNVGNSAIWVDSPPGAVSHIQDLDECASTELHDCHAQAKCINVFGGFRCECGEGLKDPWADNKHKAGRHCEQCSSQHCNNRGQCKYQNTQEVCVCVGNYYGAQCEVDGEILGVAIGASVAAVIIIGLTLVCLVMWSRRWSREHKASVQSPVFGYMGGTGTSVKTPVVGGPPYQVTMEDRIRWAQIADVMAQSNHYAPEPVTAPTRPSSAMFGYPNLSYAGTLQRGAFHGTLPPVPLPRLGLQAQLAARAASVQGMKPLDNSSSSEEEDRTDLLGRSFQVPRPKSRSNASVTNQSGIYYDVDYEQNEFYKQGSGIPMSTYAIGRPYYRS